MRKLIVLYCIILYCMYCIVLQVGKVDYLSVLILFFVSMKDFGNEGFVSGDEIGE
jgi:hypothetical protein